MRKVAQSQQHILKTNCGDKETLCVNVVLNVCDMISDAQLMIFKNVF